MYVYNATYTDIKHLLIVYVSSGGFRGGDVAIAPPPLGFSFLLFHCYHVCVFSVERMNRRVITTFTHISI